MGQVYVQYIIPQMFVSFLLLYILSKSAKHTSRLQGRYIIYIRCSLANFSCNFYKLSPLQLTVRELDSVEYATLRHYAYSLTYI